MRASTVGVIGAGTMGRGIAQVAATAGDQVLLYDMEPSATQRALFDIKVQVRQRVDKGRLSESEGAELIARIRPASSLSDLNGAGVVIEAVKEDLAIKTRLFSEIAARNPTALLATNTSSLSVTAIASGTEDPSVVIGLHFFNPAPAMKLVEIVPGMQTSSRITALAGELVRRWGKTAVHAKDVPGFIVNRVARPFYGESLRIVEEQIAQPATVDWAMRELAGFKMGPFELMDLIGIDVNYAVTVNVFEGYHYDPRYRPSVLQKRLVESGRLGRKSGEGFYRHGPNQRTPEPVRDEALGRTIVKRVVSMLINEAFEAVYYGVCSQEDLETAMTLGVSYPQGLFAWADELGLETVLAELSALRERYAEERYRPSVLLRTMAAAT